MAIVNSMAAALASSDRFNLVNQWVFWEIHDNVEHRTVEMFADKSEALAAYAKRIEDQAPL